MSYTTGRRYEQELVQRFRAHGFGALRLGASGGGGDADLPDVFAGRELDSHYGYNEALAIELKSGKASTLYVGEDEVAALEAFADSWGARAYLGARSTRQGTSTDTYLVPPARAHRTPEDNYALRIDDVAERAAVVVGEDGVEWV